MAFPDLQQFISHLESIGQLKRVKVEVDPILEIAEITDRMCKMPAAGSGAPTETPVGSTSHAMPPGARRSGPSSAVPEDLPRTDPTHGGFGGHALLFENVKGSAFPCVTNLFGSYARMKLALGVDDLDEMAQRVQSFVKPEMPTTLMEKMKKLPDLAKLATMGPKVVRSGMCQQVVQTENANFFDWPIIQCWPFDGQAGYAGRPEDAEPGTGRYITYAGTYTKNPETQMRNVGMYRVQIMGEKHAAMHWHMHHDGARHCRMYQERGEKMPVAIVFGGEPLLTYAATCPLPPDVSELLFAGFLHGKGIDLVPGKTIPLDVPANAEIVYEGWVDPNKLIWEGPFGDHTGFYSLADRYPVFELSAVTHRKNPVYPTTIVGPPPQEDYYLGKATERIFLPLLKMLIPDIIDYHLPMFGAFHNFVFVKIRKEYPMQARKVMSSIWGAGQMMFSKFIIVVDADVDVHNEQEVLFKVGANVDPRRDIVMVDGPIDILDHASPYYGAGSKMGIDATKKMPGEGIVREYPEALVMDEQVRTRVERRWAEYGF